jgi:superfamily II DNA helicase RecQ
LEVPPEATSQGRNGAIPVELVVESILTLRENLGFDGRGMVFAPSKERCEQIFHELTKVSAEVDLTVVMYHAGMEQQAKSASRRRFVDSTILGPVVMICTTAAGAGLDYPCVRWTLHDSIVYGDENFAQETGRAGRDGKPALCIVLVNDHSFYWMGQLQEEALKDTQTSTHHNLLPTTKHRSLQVALQILRSGIHPRRGEFSVSYTWHFWWEKDISITMTVSAF